MAGNGGRADGDDHRDGELEAGWELGGHDGAGRRVRLVFGETQLRRCYPGLAIGRHPALNDLVVDDPTVSRRHLRLSRDGEQMLIEDLNSLNGSAVDGELLRPFTPAVIEEGQEIAVGALVLTLRPLAS
jgi:hypothetical protein